MSYTGTAAIIGKGTVVEYSATLTGTYTPLGEVLKVSIPKVTTKDIDCTNMNSTAEEIIEGLPSAAEVDIEANYFAAEFVTLYAQVGAGKLFWKIIMPDGTHTAAFAGFTKDVTVEAETQTKLVTKLKVKPTGQPTMV